MADGGSAPCWCAGLPPVVPVGGDDARCWCPQCLKQHIGALRDALRDPLPASQNGNPEKVPPDELK
jgi:hypothetical protein